MLNLASFFIWALGIVSFSFVLWKNLKEDYLHEKIFSLTLIILGAGALFWLIFSSRIGYYAFWAAGLALSVVCFYLIRKLEFKVFEFADAVIPAWFLFSFFFSLADFLRTPFDPLKLAWPAISLLSILAYNFFLKRYRRFSWYPSGRVGFAGFASLGFYFFLRLGVAIYMVVVISLNEAIFEIPANFFFTLLSLFVIYLRSGRSGAEKILNWREK